MGFFAKLPSGCILDAHIGEDLRGRTPQRHKSTTGLFPGLLFLEREYPNNTSDDNNRSYRSYYPHRPADLLRRDIRRKEKGIFRMEKEKIRVRSQIEEFNTWIETVIREPRLYQIPYLEYLNGDIHPIDDDL